MRRKKSRKKKKRDYRELLLDIAFLFLIFALMRYVSITGFSAIDTSETLYVTSDITLDGGTYIYPTSKAPTAAIIILNDGVTVDCNGAKLVGSEKGVGILNSGFEDVVIKNCEITNFEYGLNIISDNTTLININSYGNVIENISHDGLTDPLATPSENVQLSTQEDSENLTFEQKFNGFATTNLSAVADLSSVPELTLHNSKGKIKYIHNVNAGGEDIEDAVTIGDKFITVDSNQLDNSFKGPAVITINDVKCPVEIFYYGGVASSNSEILSNGQPCDAKTNPACTNIECLGSTLIFVAPEFSSYGTNESGGAGVQGEGGGEVGASAVPSHTTPVINTTTGANRTDENITVYNQSTSDGDGDEVKNIVNWYVNGSSIEVLSMTFDHNNSNGTGHVKDYSGRDNNGTVSGAIFNQTGGFDGKGAFEFNPSSTPAIVTKNTGLSNYSGTIVSWVKSHDTSPGGDRFIFMGSVPTGDRISANINRTTGTYSVILGSTRADTTGQFTQNNWHHIALVWNFSNFTAYFDGDEVSSGTHSGIDAISSCSAIGHFTNCAGSKLSVFDGTIDEVGFYAVPLTGQQIRAIYENKTNTIVASEMRLTDKWSACITPNDGTGDGSTLCSVNLSVVSNNIPSHSMPLLNSTSGNNLTADNLTVFNQSTFDADGDEVRNIIDWRLNGSSIAVLNMPFENWGSNSTHNVSNTSVDYSIYGNNGTTNGTTWNASVSFDGSGSYDFDGIYDYITIPHSPELDIGPSFAIEVWFKKRAVTGTYHIFVSKNQQEGGDQPGYIFGLAPNSTIRLFWEDSSNGNHQVYGNTTFTGSTEWVHAVGVRDADADQAYIYINGVLDGVVTDSVDIGDTVDAPVLIGAERPGLYNFSGSLDNVRIYNHSLSATQVRALYENKTDTIVSAETTVGDDWNACITPNDGNSSGGELCSVNLTINANSAPTHSSPLINSTSGNNLTADNLTVFNQSTFDADGDEVKNIINWYKEGNSITKLHLPFDHNNSNGTAKTKDYSGNGVEANVSSDALFVPAGGFDGKGAYNFSINSTDSKILLTNNILNPQDLYTVELWAKAVDSTTNGRMVALFSSSNNKIEIGIYSSSAEDDLTENTIFFHDKLAGSWKSHKTNVSLNNMTGLYDKWTHFAFIRNGTGDNDKKMFINGQEAPLVPDSTLSYETQRSALGKRLRTDSSPDHNYLGFMDDVKFYNFSLSDEQVKTNYENKTNTIVSQETSIGDKWSACITPNDGLADGTELCSVNLTIQNTAPTHDTPILNTTLATNLTSENITVYNKSTVDADGTVVRNIISWYKNGFPIGFVHMPFEHNNSNGTGHVKDYSGRNHNGSVLNATWNATGGFDGRGAYEFGTGDYINLGEVTGYGGNVTVAAWIKKSTQTNTFDDLVTGGCGDLVFYVRNDNLGYFGGQCNSPFTPIATSTNLNDGNWHHVAGTYDGRNVSIYVDGEREATSVVSGSFTPSNLTISHASEDFIGTVDEFLMLNYSLTGQQIKLIYENRSDIILSSDTGTSETWQACITPNDGLADGEQKCSQELTIVTPPSHSTPVINSTLGTNTSAENLTLFNQSTFDFNGEEVRNIYNWYVNGTSIIALNMPFEHNNSYSTGQTKDYSGNNNIGNVSGAVFNSTGGFDGEGAYEFDGSDDYIVTTNFGLSNYSGAVMAWVKAATAAPPGSDVIIMGSRDPNRIYISHNDTTGTVSYTVGSTNEHTSSTLIIGEWHHVALVWNGSSYTTYFDGAETASGSHSGISSFSACASIGAYNSCAGTANGNFNGAVDEVLFFNRSLSGSQVRAIYENRTDRIVSAETRVTDKWHGCVTPNDGGQDGTELCSTNLTVLVNANGAPTHDVPVINATLGTNTTDENLTVWNQSTSDVDGDSVKNIYNWYRNGSSTTVLVATFDNNNSNGTGHVKDYSGLDNNGSVVGATWNANAGLDGKGAYQFDGNDYLNFGVDPDFDLDNGELTLTAWIRAEPTMPGIGQYIFDAAGSGGSSDRYTVRLLEGSGVLRLVGRSQGGETVIRDSTIKLNDSNWHHIAAIFDVQADALLIYVDGVLNQGSQSSSFASTVDIDSIFTIGSVFTGADGFFNGTIDDVRIYNTTLSANQVRALYENKTNVVVSSETAFGSNWSACVTPNDGFLDGEEKCSVNLTIGGETANFRPSFTEFAIDSNTIALYHLDETSGDVIDATGKNNGTSFGALRGQAGKLNASYFFDGNNDYVLIPNSKSLNFTEVITYEAWFKETSRSKNSKLVSKRKNKGAERFIMGLNKGKLFGRIRANSSLKFETTPLPNAVPLNEWHYGVFTYNDSANSMKVYLDGELIAEKTTTQSLPKYETGLTIGANREGAGGFYEGYIDEVRISNVSRDFSPKGLIVPEDEAEENVNFTFYNWSDAVDREGDTVGYNLQVSTSSDFSGYKININLTNTNYTLASNEGYDIDNTFYWRVCPYDDGGYGNCSETRSYAVDIYPPVIRNASRGPPTVNNDQDANISAWIGGGVLDTVYLTSNYSGTFVNYSDGVYNLSDFYFYNISAGNFSDRQTIGWYWWANDTGGGQQTGNTQTFTIENRPPIPPNSSFPLNGTNHTDLPILLQWTNTTDSDDDNGCDLGGCTFNFTVYGSTDIDNVSDNEPSALLVSTNELNYTWNVTTSGVFYWQVVADDGFDVNESEIFQFIADTEPPELRVAFNDSQVEFGIDSLTIDWNATDFNNDTGQANVSYPNGTIIQTLNNDSIDFILYPSNMSVTGNYTVSVFGNDTLNNSNGTDFIFLVSDTTEPNVTLVEPLNNTYNNGSLNINCNATDADLASIFLYHNTTGTFGEVTGASRTGTANETNFGLSGITEGQIIWNCWANDTSGNSAFGQFNYTFVSDRTNPSISVGLNDSQVEFGIDSVLIDWNSSDPNINTTIANVTYPNGTLIQQLLDVSSDFILVPTNLSVTGTYSVDVLVNDSTGNENLSSFTFNVTDTINPTVLISFNDSSVEYLTDSLRIDWNVTDVSINVTKANVSYPNGTLLQELTNTGNDFVLFPSNLSVTGTYLVVVFSNDTSGNEDTTNVAFSVVDSATPNVTLVSPVDDFSQTETNLTFTCNATSSSLGNISLFHDISGNFELNQSAVISNTDNESNFTVSGISLGTYTWNCKAAASTGQNSFADSNRSFTISLSSTESGGTTAGPPSSPSERCNPHWVCTSWSSCSDRTRTRSCSDLNGCGRAPPAEEMACECNTEWICGGFGSCQNGESSRVCSKVPGCWEGEPEPATSISCMLKELKEEPVEEKEEKSDVSEVSLEEALEEAKVREKAGALESPSTSKIGIEDLAEEYISIPEPVSNCYFVLLILLVCSSIIYFFASFRSKK